MTKNIFCANCQTEKDHEITITSKEVIAECECGRSIKFPASNDAALFKSLFNIHKLSNIGQVPAKEAVIDPAVAAAINEA